MAINWKNTAENLGLVMAGFLVGALVGYRVTISTAKSMVREVRPTIEKAIDKESIKNEIKNEIKIDKIKKSDSIKITLEPINNQKPVNVLTKKDSTKQKKKGFFARLFGKKDKKQK